MALLAFASGPAFAQGTTSAAMSGTITDANGDPIPGANVVAVHEPSGTRYGGATRIDGQYNLRGLRVGGPYTVTATFVGYTDVTQTGIQTTLGQSLTLDFVLREDIGELGSIEVTAEEDAVLSASRTGARTVIGREEIDQTPTISRSLADIARLTPQAGGGSSDQTTVAGRNNRYNNIQIDGATLNDVFGLSGTGAPGGQAGAQPISLDAIEAFNVDIAPYDVRYSGFTGGLINAITRSGTNEFSGSVRYLGRNQDLAGALPVRQSDGTFTDQRLGDFTDQYFVGTLGGPIVRDKVFFFANVEYQDQATPLNAGVIGSGAATIFQLPTSALDSIRTIAQDRYNYDAGTTDAFTDGTSNIKLLGKLDWVLNDANRLSLRASYVDAQDDAGISRSVNNFDFSNRLYQFNSNTLSTVAELRSQLGNSAFNEARLVYTGVRDSRDVQAQPFPYVQIVDQRGGETSNVYLGIDRFSQANSLDQDLIEFTNNLTLYKGDHTVTLGTSNQFFRFNNLFIQDFYGGYVFDSIEDFASGDPSRYYLSTSLLDDPQPRAEFSAAQLGAYVQDEFQATPLLRLTGGLRVDLPVFPSDPLNNPASEEAFGLRTDEVPSGNFLFSPRLGFNYAVNEARSTQLRGGTGLFAGRTPYVWISNQYSNTGVDFARIDVRNPDIEFNPSADPESQAETAAQLPTGQTAEINLTDEDFKFPQVWRTNLAIDQQLAGGFVATVEGIYSKAINDIDYTNLNIIQTGTSFEGRPIYGDAAFAGSTSRTLNGSTNRDDDRFTNALLLRNTSEGYEYNVTGQLRRDALNDGTVLGGLSGSLSYTYGRATSVNNGTSSRAISNWQFNENFDVNNAEVGTADFEVRHRVLGTMFYRAEYGGRFASSFGLILDSRAGNPFSWIYAGNANGDTQSFNDLVYIPASEDDIILTTGNYSDLDAFIQSEPSLADNRGTVAERNTARTPWQNLLDLQFTQEIQTVQGQKVELTANLLNVLNLLNNDWGRVYFRSNDNQTLLNFYGYVDADDVGTTIAGQTIAAGDVGKPVVGYAPNTRDNNGDGEVDRTDIFSSTALSSRWQLQLGIRYTF
ncbi:TonB-dependent receptor [Rubricoccus marinus]|uniref:TonB-dependent receptor n=1 Tax=Rubricoccus marinus TaxID=716817 RepID=A0A259U4J0_9BACT|nr:TonB-dependent receptor [Rubricoccus marinus]